MGAIKDAVDLVIELEKRITDRKILDMLFPIKQAIHKASEENLESERNNFQLERKHHEEVANLKSSHEKEVAKLSSEIEDLNSKLKTASEPSFGIHTIGRS